MNRKKLIESIMKSDLTGKQKLYLEKLVDQKSAYWKRNEYHEAYCSVCDFYCALSRMSRYCPNCGALMHGYEGSHFSEVSGRFAEQEEI